MSRLIDADKLKKPIYAEDDNCTGDGMTYDEMAAYNDGIDIVWRRIESAPTVDAEPVVHGHWILEREPDGKPYCFHCSVCDDDFHHIGIKSATDYCPNCGARLFLEV